jgi:Nucleotidyltransferase domain
VEKRLARTVDDVLGASPLALAEVEDTDAGVRRSSDAERPAPRGAYRCRAGSPTLTEVRQRKSEVEDVARRRGAHNVRVFGSVARGGQRPGNDVDFLVDLEEGRGLFDLGGC